MSDIEERLEALEAEFRATKEELQQILLDIRTFQMESQSPLPTDAKKGKVPAKREAEKGVEAHGD